MWIRGAWTSRIARRGYATVQWREWAQSAFEQAQSENKLVFVNSFSHSQWCDMMAKDTFTNEDVVNTLNSKFVPIKIQKDDNRAIDKSLMMFLQLKANGQGGWPLNIVLTPTKFQPFIAASYLSADDLNKFLKAGSSVWSEKPEVCENFSEEATQQLISIRDSDHGKQTQLDIQDALEQAALQYKSLATQSPRFVMGYALSVLGGELCSTVLHEMAKGGIVDQLEGGAYTYSISSDWHFPSFQKTLSGQATLLMACATHLRSNSDDQVVRNLANKLVEFTADLLPNTSITCSSSMWKYNEFVDALKPKMELRDRDIAQMVWGVNENGNINSELDPLNTCYAQNVLTQHTSNDDVAKSFGVSSEKVQQVFEESRGLLTEYRKTHKEPSTVNERIVLSDLGLTLSGLSQISAFVPTAQSLANELAAKLQDPNTAPTPLAGRTCDDYAFAIMGLLDYHEYVEPTSMRCVDAAHVWLAAQIEKFQDTTNGGFFYSPDIPNLYFRPKYSYDGAEPNYNGVSARNIQRLTVLGYSEYAENVDSTKNVGVHGVLSSPLAHLSFLHS